MFNVCLSVSIMFFVFFSDRNVGLLDISQYTERRSYSDEFLDLDVSSGVPGTPFQDLLASETSYFPMPKVNEVSMQKDSGSRSLVRAQEAAKEFASNNAKSSGNAYKGIGKFMIRSSTSPLPAATVLPSTSASLSASTSASTSASSAASSASSTSSLPPTTSNATVPAVSTATKTSPSVANVSSSGFEPRASDLGTENVRNNQVFSTSALDHNSSEGKDWFSIAELMADTFPVKSRIVYLKAYKSFERFLKAKDQFVPGAAPTEEAVLNYFHYLKFDCKWAPTTMWSTYARLNACIKRTHGFSLKSFVRVSEALKSFESGHRVKKASIFTPQQVHYLLFVLLKY